MRTAEDEAGRISRLLERRRLDAVERLFPWAEYEATVGSGVVDALRDEAVASAVEHGERMAIPLVVPDRERTVEKAATVTTSLAFDVTDPRARLAAERQSATLVRDITAKTQAGIRQTVGRAFSQQVTVRTTGAQIAQILRPPAERAASQIPLTMGLHDRWATAVVRYEANEIGRLVRAGVDPFEAGDVARIRSVRYAEKLVAKRGTVIARTEILRASNVGRRLAWDQAIDRRLLDPATARKEWIIAGGACEICDPVGGEQVAIDEFFSTGVDMPPAHPQCRCTAVVRYGDPMPKPEADAPSLTGFDLGLDELPPVDEFL